MRNIKRFATLWIAFFLFNLIASMDDEDDWGSNWDSDDEIEMSLPDCVPNFFMKSKEVCKCVGIAEKVEVGKSYCFPATDKFKANVNGKLKKISIPTKYQDNLVQNEELESCIPNEEEGVSDVCFCGTEDDKEKIKNSEDKLVNLNHICVPVLENEKMDFLSLSEELPHYKSPYCYENKCQRHSKNYTEEKQLINKMQKSRENWMQRLNEEAKQRKDEEGNVEEADIEKIKLILKEQEKKETSIGSQEEKNERIIKWLTAKDFKKTPLHYAAQRQDGMEIIQVLFEIFGENNEKLIEFVMKKDEEEKTALHLALFYQSKDLKEEILSLLLSPFYVKQKNSQDYFTTLDLNSQNKKLMKQNRPNKLVIDEDVLKRLVFREEKEKLIQFMMDEENSKQTSLHLATIHSNVDILKFLVTLFEPEEVDRLIELLMKSDKAKKTVFHHAVERFNAEKLEPLLNIFRTTNKSEKLFECLIKGNQNEDSALHVALENKNGKIVELLTERIILKKKNQQIVDYCLKKNNNNLNILQTAKQVLNLHYEKEEEYEERQKLRRHWEAMHNYHGMLIPQNQNQITRVFSCLHGIETCSCIQNEKLLTKIGQNGRVLRNLQLLLKVFRRKSLQAKNECSPIMDLFDRDNLSEIILKYLVVEFDQNLHSIQEDKEN